MECLKVGDLYRRDNSNVEWWTSGKVYMVLEDDKRRTYLQSDDEDTWYVFDTEDEWLTDSFTRVVTNHAPLATDDGGDGVRVTVGAKDTNPKDAVGIRKVPLSTVSAPVLAEVGVAMLEGARKYGRHNYRVAGVRTSVYYDASLRHLMQFWEGEDTDPDSGLSHITKAIAGLVVLRDAMINDKLVDDRPPKAKQGFIRDLEENVNELFDKYPDAKEAYTDA